MSEFETEMKLETRSSELLRVLNIGSWSRKGSRKIDGVGVVRIRNVLVFIRFCKFSRETKIVVVANLSIVMLVPRRPSMALPSKSVCYTILIMLDRRILVLDQLIIP